MDLSPDEDNFQGRLLHQVGFCSAFLSSEVVDSKMHINGESSLLLHMRGGAARPSAGSNYFHKQFTYPT